MKKLTELEKIKYWIDAEFSILHTMFAVIMLELTTGFLVTTLLVLYIIYTMVYGFIRLAYLAQDDPNFLRIPKK